MEKSKKKRRGNRYRNFIELVAVGSLTGVFAGAVVTLFSLLVHEGEKISQNAYAYVRENPAFLPLLLLGLLCGAFLIGVVVNVTAIVRGGGVPQAEGAARGIVPLKWWRDLTMMFAGTLVGVFAGLSVGAEGPSIFIGGCAGDGVSRMLKRDKMINKYQITGGACAGLAVAFNAPLMGMAFAFEEAHKRFTPEVFICAFTSVIFGMLTRFLIYALLGMETVNAFSRYLFYELPAIDYIFVGLAGLVCGLAGLAFYKLCFFFRRLFRKIQLKDTRSTLFLRVFIVVFLGGIVSLSASSVMGGGQGLIEGFGTLGGMLSPEVSSVFGLSFVWSVLVVLLLKFFITTVNVGSGIPCGMLIPMLAIGACLGGLLSGGFMLLGMEEKYADLMVMICMAAFFTTVVRAPITAIAMVCELTGSFAPLLPVIIAVAIGYFIGEIAKTDGIYEELLETYEKEAGLHERAVKEVYTLSVAVHSIADRREVGEVLWPAGAWVKEIHRGEEVILPDGSTLLHGGDTLVIVCKTTEPQAVKEELVHILS